MAKKEMIEVENINIPGQISNVNADKYKAMRGILLAILPREPPGLTQEEMGTAVLPHLPQKYWPNGEKSMWWIKTVQLDLEAKGLVIRNKESRPTRWYCS